MEKINKSYTKENYHELVKTLQQYIKAYYVDNKPLVSDAEYDGLYKELVDIEKQHPDWIATNSPTQKVGELESNDFAKKKHVSRMYSLDNVFTPKELAKFIRRFSPLKNDFPDIHQYYVDCKLDGLAIELVYNDGNLTEAITRGNGEVGCDVLKNALMVLNIPHRVKAKNTIVVRGEIIVHKEDFLLINSEREHNGLPTYSTCRNYAAGSLMQKSPEETKKRNLRFYAWECIVPSSLYLEQDRQIELLTELGFNTPTGRICNSIDEIQSVINDIARMRIELPYEIDGVVIKQNKWEYRKILGWNNHAPKWAVAWKFHPDGSETTIRQIIWSMGKTGRLTPVAIVDPVGINGVTINQINLYNAGYLIEKNIGPGAKVRVIRSGEVIPRITDIISHGSPATIPTKCPYCGTELTFDQTTLRCHNPNCREILVSLISSAVGSDMLNVKGISTNTIHELVHAGDVKQFIDIFFPISTTNKKLQGIADKLVTNMRQINNLELLMIIGIPNIGKATAGRIITETGSLKGLITTFESPKAMKLMMIPYSIKKNLEHWYAVPGNKELLHKLSELNLPNLK